MKDITIPKVSHATLRFDNMWALQRDLQPFALTHHGSPMFLCFPAEFVNGIPTESALRRALNWIDWYLDQTGDKE
jgi:hypothetical protein